MRTIGIEAFLGWVYREELPKAEAPGTGAGLSSAMFGAGGWDAVSRQGELMADMVSDGRVNSYGVVPLSAWYGAPPHEDAFTAHRFVGELAQMDLVLPDDWSPLQGLGLSPQEERAAVARAMPRIAVEHGDRWRLHFKPVELVRRYAILGGCPPWEAQVPKARFVELHGKPQWFRIIMVEGAFGRLYEREVDGYNARSKRPYPGAYRKTYLEPDPMGAVIERAEYEVWHAALAGLTEDLNASGELIDHRISMSDRSARPWAP
ncbi:hypothetical protein [Bosea sp. FBZP-16]|uniref:hypothetical protein n=1 Tax=Bosea sp. FBZP-16 TaxID=2065382 RepID=UPI000C30F976|nr:hypothetical protein [Bosea sp. FBZP-16]